MRIYSASHNSHRFANTAILEKENVTSATKKNTIPISRPVRNDESPSRAPFGQGFDENSTVNPLSGSARFKIYRRRVIFAIPTRRSHGVCYSPENAEERSRTLAANARVA